MLNSLSKTLPFFYIHSISKGNCTVGLHSTNAWPSLPTFVKCQSFNTRSCLFTKFKNYLLSTTKYLFPVEKVCTILHLLAQPFRLLLHPKPCCSPNCLIFPIPCSIARSIIGNSMNFRQRKNATRNIVTNKKHMLSCLIKPCLTWLLEKQRGTVKQIRHAEKKYRVLYSMYMS